MRKISPTGHVQQEDSVILKLLDDIVDYYSDPKTMGTISHALTEKIRYVQKNYESIIRDDIDRIAQDTTKRRYDVEDTEEVSKDD